MKIWERDGRGWKENVTKWWHVVASTSWNDKLLFSKNEKNKKVLLLMTDEGSFSIKSIDTEATNNNIH